MRDRDATRIRPTPVTVTVGQLATIPIPQVAYPRDRRIAPEELTVYRVRAIVDDIIVEGDGDWHIVLKDPVRKEATIVAEIPDPKCVSDPKLRALLTEARRVLHFIPRRGIADFEGVGFFDFVHPHQIGARNGFELHPVLAIRLVQHD